jgi:hypothetical protein
MGMYLRAFDRLETDLPGKPLMAEREGVRIMDA